MDSTCGERLTIAASEELDGEQQDESGVGDGVAITLVDPSSARGERFRARPLRGMALPARCVHAIRRGAIGRGGPRSSYEACSAWLSGGLAGATSRRLH